MPTTDSQTELLTQVDEDNNVIGSVSRKIAHNDPSIYYRTIFILVKDIKGRILLQKRSATKDLYPNCWDLSVGGHVTYGDSYLTTARKEIREELGLNISEDDLLFKGQVLVKLPKSNEYFHVFEYQLKPTDNLNLSEEEVSAVKWMSIAEIKHSMKNKSISWYERPEQVISALY